MIFLDIKRNVFPIQWKSKVFWNFDVSEKGCNINAKSDLGSHTNRWKINHCATKGRYLCFGGRFLEGRKIDDFLMVITAVKNLQTFVLGAPRGRKVGCDPAAACENGLRHFRDVPARGPGGPA